jgi:hypothetical protein
MFIHKNSSPVTEKFMPGCVARCGGARRRHFALPSGVVLAVLAGFPALLHQPRGGLLDAVAPGDSRQALGEIRHAVPRQKDVAPLLAEKCWGSAEQKSEAQFQRGMLYKDLDRLAEAREDLEAVCSTDELFSGVFARAFVDPCSL